MSSTLFYWRGGGEVRHDVLAAIRAEGYDLQVVHSFEDIVDGSRRRLPAILVVDASAGESEASSRVVELNAAELLKNVPIVFISYQAHKRSTVLKRQYLKFVAVDIPFQLPALLAQLRELHPAKPVSEESLNRAAPTRGSGQTGEPLTSNRNPLKLHSGVGGETYALGHSLSAFDDDLLLPHVPYREILGRALNDITNRNLDLGLRARRIAFVSAAVLNALGLTEGDEKILRAASLLLNWGLRSEGRFITSVDLFFPENQGFSQKVARGFAASASFVRENLQDSATADLILDIAAHLTPQKDALPRADTHSGVVLALELTDRACWAHGQWDPYGAHRALRSLHSGTPVLLGKNVKTSLSRMLAEAASFRQNDYTPTPITPDHQAQITEAKKTAAAFAAKKLKHVDVSVHDLEPGMRIASPIFSWDGHLVLGPNVVLDHEMLDRLLHVATVRPLLSPVKVVTDTDSAVAFERVSL